MKVLQLLPTLAMGDAIGNDVRALEKVIRGMTENALKGKFTGGAIPFGYIINADHHLCRSH